jgi:hypothetical protein
VKARLSAIAVALVALLFLISLFLPWAEQDVEDVTVWRARGWETVAAYGAFPALGLLLWELLRAAGVRIGVRSPALVSFFLGAGAAFFGVSAVIHVRWGATFTDVESLRDLQYGAWIALWTSVLILAAAIARLAEHALDQHERRPS